MVNRFRINISTAIVILVTIIALQTHKYRDNGKKSYLTHLYKYNSTVTNCHIACMSLLLITFLCEIVLQLRNL